MGYSKEKRSLKINVGKNMIPEDYTRGRAWYANWIPQLDDIYWGGPSFYGTPYPADPPVAIDHPIRHPVWDSQDHDLDDIYRISPHLAKAIEARDFEPLYYANRKQRVTYMPQHDQEAPGFDWWHRTDRDT